MSTMDEIRRKVIKRQYEFSKHAVDQTIRRNITVAEIEEALTVDAEMIEKYPQDKYGPSFLILGWTTQRRPLHIQCGDPRRSCLKIITVYEPDPVRWVDHKFRIGVR